VVDPNNDTLYSTAWLDLGTEPIVLGVPDIPDDRYYVIQIVDMYTFNSGRQMGARGDYEGITHNLIYSSV